MSDTDARTRQMGDDPRLFGNVQEEKCNPERDRMRELAADEPELAVYLIDKRLSVIEERDARLRAFMVLFALFMFVWLCGYMAARSEI